MIYGHLMNPQSLFSKDDEKLPISVKLISKLCFKGIYENNLCFQIKITFVKPQVVLVFIK